MTEILEALTNDSSTYFWFYSTIIQALAAMIAVVGMFFVYMFEVESRRVADKISDLRYKFALVKTVDSTISLDRMLNITHSYSVGKLIEEVDKQLRQCQDIIKANRKGNSETDRETQRELNRTQNNLNTLEPAYNEYKRAERNAQSSRKYIKKPLIFAGCVITFSILMLPLSKSFATSQLIWRYEGLVPLFIVLFSSCFAIWIIIRAVVKVATMESF